MSTPATNTATVRRRRYALQTGVLVLAVTACCGFLLLIASRWSVQINRFTTREHVLAERTRRLISSLNAQYDVVVAANFDMVDPESAQRTIDVLDTFDRASDHIAVTVINTGSTSGMDKFRGVMRDLAARYSKPIERHVTTLNAAAGRSLGLADSLKQLADSLTKAGAGVPATFEQAGKLTAFFQQAAGQCRADARDLEAAAGKVHEDLDKQLDLAPIPPLDSAAGVVQPVLSRVATNLAGIGDNLEALSKADPKAAPPAAADLARPLSRMATELRDLAARTSAEVEDLPPLAVLRVARTLERTSAVLVIGPPDAPRGGVTAVDFSSLFPPRLPASEGAFRLDERDRAEELIATALTSVSDPTAPVVVFVHGEKTRFAPDYPYFRAAAQRLALRGMDLVEWPVVLDGEPKLGAIGDRPVVYVVLPTNASSPEGAARMGKLAAAVAKLIKRGESVLLSVTPSTLPTTGNEDPMVSCLDPLGIDVKSGLPLLHATRTPTGQVDSADFDLMPDLTECPIAGAIRGLRVRLLWPMPIHAKGASADGVSTWPILKVKDDDSVWGESDWVGFRQIPAQQRSQLINPPAQDSPRDDGDGPWTVALAAERHVQSRDASQRLVVVASNGWFFDEVTQPAVMVGNRRAPVDPGNLELLESSVYWLAHKDGYVATTAAAAEVSRIEPLTPGAMRAIQWSLIGGLPLLVLLLGAVLRLLRG